MYARTAETRSVSRNRLPDNEMLPATAAEIIHDELMLDGNARLNLATFVTTWMEPEARVLMTESFDKNMIDKDEYPQTAELEARCVSMLAHLWHSPDHTHATGCSTTGSSEAAMLGGLALKRRWQHARRAAGKSTDRPNLVMGVNVQVCWEKFANYFEVEPRYVPMSGERFHLDAAEAVAHCDENTIGVVAVLGSTFDGSYEPVAEIAGVLDDLAARGGPDVPVHVDGASGAMIAPFIDPELPWDFRLRRVASINTSGHKYGLVYPGVGWIVWRNEEALPDDLVFKVNYLGGEMPTFALNFSRPGAQVVAQYYNFLRLGRAGYKAVQQACRDVAMYLSGRIAALPQFELVTDGSELPVFAVRLADGVTGYDVFDVSRGLREGGWLVPAYTFPENRTDLAVLRVVVRNSFSRDLADLLLDTLTRTVAQLERDGGRRSGGGMHAFHH
ncbi:glutamate decarboxylase [Actinocatenispora rupis]|nr:glutamate decarboxylase [Actinocatenispora rupis]